MPSPPPELFHYTSAEALQGIVTSGEVWASVVHYMNDPSEFAHAIDIARDLLLEVLTDASSEQGEACEAVNDHFRNIRFRHVCAFSLSAEGDLLSQWRAYTPPSGGYAVGFSTEALIASAASAGFRLVECVYDVEVQRAQLKPLIERVVDDLVGARGTRTPLAPLATKFADEFSEIAASFKDPSFSEEREWRLVSGVKHSTDPAFELRPRGGLFVISHEHDPGRRGRFPRA